MRRLAAIAVVVAVLAMTLPFVQTATAGSTKFTFNNVTFADGTAGEIEASSKVGKNTAFTTCSYYSVGYISYLGYFTSSAFASVDRAAVLQFCLDYYGDRELH